jgi:hypothetical protein
VRRKKQTKPLPTKPIAIGGGIAIIVIVILVSYYLDQTKISGQKFGDDLALIQSDLKNETDSFDKQLTMYKNGQLSKDEMLKIADAHIANIQNILTRYDELKPPETFVPSVQLFRLSTQTEIESDKYLREWIQTGDNSSQTKSDQLLQQSFQYEMSGLQSYGNAKTKWSQ